MASGCKVIAITGATTGLGNAMAKEFLSLGHKVAGCGRTASKIQQLVQQFDSLPDRCDFAVADVSIDEEVKLWAQRVLTKFGPPDYLINNSGIGQSGHTLWDVTAEEFGRVVDINVKGPANVVRHFVPSMMAAERGVIVNVTSFFGRNNVPTFGTYATSKWALEGFSRTLAAEIPEPLVSFQLDPGIVGTPMTEVNLSPEIYSTLLASKEWAESVCPKLLTIDRSINGKIWETSDLGLKNAIYFEDEKLVMGVRTKSK